MKYLISLATLTLLLTACGEDSISFKVHPARPAPDIQAQPPDGWQLVEFAGSSHGQAGVNIIEFRDAGELTIAVRLNAYSIRQLQQFANEPTNLKQPLAININGRWADFFPFLQALKDRMFLYGFTKRRKSNCATLQKLDKCGGYSARTNLLDLRRIYFQVSRLSAASSIGTQGPCPGLVNGGLFRAL